VLISDDIVKHVSWNLCVCLRYRIGYSVAAGEKDSVSLYFTGAPRYKHTGEVVLFRKTNNIWKVVHRVAGEQVGPRCDHYQYIQE